MNNRIIVFILFLFFSIGADTLSAQSSLSFGSSGVQHEDTLSIGDSIHFSFWLVNQGNTSINDSLQILCETFDIIGSPISFMSIGDSYNTVGSLNVGDSIAVTITELVTYQSFVLGDNIIVIWPALIGSGTGETSNTNIHIIDIVSNGDEIEILDNNLIIYPNPTSDNLYFSNKIDFPISSIHISDCFGNILFKDSAIDLNNFVFNVSELRQGVYLILLRFNDRRIIRKIIVN